MAASGDVFRQDETSLCDTNGQQDIISTSDLTQYESSAALLRNLLIINDRWCRSSHLYFPYD